MWVTVYTRAICINLQWLSAAIYLVTVCTRSICINLQWVSAEIYVGDSIYAFYMYKSTVVVC